MQTGRFKKILVIVLCTCFVMVSFLPSIFIATHELHSCTGEDCIVCSRLETAKSAIKQVSTDCVIYGILAPCLTLLLLCIVNCFSSIKSVSLITLKVRMDN